MSLRAVPILFVNLGGEMLYILDQRLRAQSIPPDKARKVMHDIVSTMFNGRFMEQLFKPQEIYSKKAMRTMFDRLAHASIMRLNAASMDKLYDLMTMAVKYQISLCLRPSDMLLVALNHVDAMFKFVENVPAVKQMVETVYLKLIETYRSLSIGEFQIIRQTLLGFFQDVHIRVSIFLKDRVQNSNGKFVLPLGGQVPYGAEIPGTIRYFNADGKLHKTEEFHVNGKYLASLNEGSTEIQGDRVTKLGTNMYSIVRPSDTSISGAPPKETSSATAEDASANPNPMVKKELDLLAHLMGAVKSTRDKSSGSSLRVNLFNTDEEEEKFAASRPPPDVYDLKVIQIDATKSSQSAELIQIMSDMSLPDCNQDDDLLSLMDNAA